jgi:FAD/FMN-containing dehydrogenase
MPEMLNYPNLVYERLRDILGSKYVSNTPCTLVAYAAQAHASLFFGKERLSETVVTPSTTAEIQNIITFAQRNKIPVAIYSSAVFAYWSISKHGGIIIDMKRMNKIMNVDEENCLATSQAGCPLQRLTAELLKKKLFLNQGGAPSSCLVGSRFTYGNVNKASGRIGWEYRNMVGWEMVLPDGTILRNGSRANAYETEQFWAHGPGPDLWLLPRYAMGQFGVVTEITIRCHTLDEEIKPLWVSFNDIEDAQNAYIEFVHAEICTGSSLYSTFKTAGYAADTTESAYRITRMFPEIHMVLTLQGTSRRVVWEEKRVREIAKKYNGRIITDKFPPFQVAFDSQLSMAASIYSEYTVKYFTTIGSGGPGTGLSIGALDDIEAAYKFVKRLNMEQEWQGNPNKGFYADTCAPGLIVYPSEGGHYALIECMGPGIDQPALRKANSSVVPAVFSFRVETGLQADMHGGQTVPGRRDYGLWPTYIELITKFHEILDPNNIMHPGTLFPPMFR